VYQVKLILNFSVMEGNLNLISKHIIFRKYMQQEGMKGALDFDVGEFIDKAFVTFRKTKNVNETLYDLKYSFLNFINKHYTRNTNDIYTEVSIPVQTLLLIINITNSS
jgi:hypothetical protein